MKPPSPPMLCAPERKTVGRFAPSPSGRMHLGNIFTAVLAWCAVRSEDGTFLLRIEDLDPERSRSEYARQLREDLHWLGLDWDAESPPQSTRSEVYAEQFARLQCYPCYCSRTELHAAAAPHGSDGQPVYPGTCRSLTNKQRAAQSKPPAWRLPVPDRTISFTDGVQGFVSENLAKDCGDFILRRSDGVYAYQLAVVTDDALSSVTQVVRGADLLHSTPRQLYLYELLGFPAPAFYHVPLLMAPDGRRLSKRERDCDMGALRQRFTPQELLGRVAFAAGLLPSRAPVSTAELTAAFQWANVRKSSIDSRIILE